MRKLISVTLAAGLMACGASSEDTDNGRTESPTLSIEAKAAMSEESASSNALAAALASQPEATRARYAARRPGETLGFFGIEPGMTVIEALPGGGWYSKILLEYLGSDGQLIGADYAVDMFALFNFVTEEDVKQKETWRETWLAEAEQWRNDNSASVDAFVFGAMPSDLNNSADAVVMIRAMHNLARFETQGNFLTTALRNAYDALKPGGILGVVQHEAEESLNDAWADGSNGYLKKSAVIAAVTAAGFTLVAESDMNANTKDKPTTEDFVWRLPPSLVTSREDPELRAKLEAVGESNRMTLLFKKDN